MNRREMLAASAVIVARGVVGSEAGDYTEIGGCARFDVLGSCTLGAAEFDAVVRIVNIYETATSWCDEE